MASPEREHPPRTSQAANLEALGPGAVVLDVGTNARTSAEAWLADCERREGRSREECSEELMNALARGDLKVVEPGSSA